jgi:hypothetical protein
MLAACLTIVCFVDMPRMGRLYIPGGCYHLIGLKQLHLFL